MAQLCMYCRLGRLSPHGQEAAERRRVKSGPLWSLDRLVQRLREQRVSELDLTVVLGAGQAALIRAPRAELTSASLVPVIAETR